MKPCFAWLTRKPKDRLEALFDCFAPLYFVVHPFVRTVARGAVALLDDGPGLRSLDVCTGTGVVAQEMAGRGYAVTGVDLSFGMLSQRREARRRRKIAGVRMDARQLAFKDKSFDVCSISMALHEFPAADRRQILREMARVGKKHILVADYSGRQPRIVRLAEWLEGSHFEDFTDGSLGEQLTQAGLRILKQDRRLSIGMYLCEIPQGSPV